MGKFHSTRTAVETTKKFIDENHLEATYTSDFDEDFQHKKEISGYLQNHILVIFIMEFKENKKIALEAHFENFSGTMKKKKYKEEIMEKLDKDYNSDDIYKQYNTYRAERNNLVHNLNIVSLSWQDYINLEFNKGIIFDIADIGERVLWLIDKIAKNMTQA